MLRAVGRTFAADVVPKVCSRRGPCLALFAHLGMEHFHSVQIMPPFQILKPAFGKTQVKRETPKQNCRGNYESLIFFFLFLCGKPSLSKFFILILERKERFSPKCQEEKRELCKEKKVRTPPPAGLPTTFLRAQHQHGECPVHSQSLHEGNILSLLV